MPKLNTRLPKLCRDRKLAISWHNGKRIYHGVWGTPEAEKSYKRFIAALLENPTLPLRIGKESTDILVSELADAFLEAHEPRMNKTDYGHFKRAFGYLVEVYGELSVNEFSPKKLKVCRSQMVKAGTLCRKTVIGSEPNHSEFADIIRGTLRREPGKNAVYFDTDILPMFDGDRVPASAFLNDYGFAVETIDGQQRVVETAQSTFV